MSYDKKIIPEGLSLEGEWEKDTLTIRHNRVGIKATDVFLVLFFIMWTIASIEVVGAYLEDEIDGGQVIFFWVGEIAVAIILANFLFRNKVFHLSSNRLTVRTKVLWFKNVKTIHKLSISRFVQLKDEDNFTSWGIAVEGDKKIVLLDQQDYEKIYWLGNTFAEWFDVDFYEFIE